MIEDPDQVASYKMMSLRVDGKLTPNEFAKTFAT